MRVAFARQAATTGNCGTRARVNAMRSSTLTFDLFFFLYFFACLLCGWNIHTYVYKRAATIMFGTSYNARFVCETRTHKCAVKLRMHTRSGPQYDDAVFFAIDAR